jgi:hypothetical protein
MADASTVLELNHEQDAVIASSLLDGRQRSHKSGIVQAKGVKEKRDRTKKPPSIRSTLADQGQSDCREYVVANDLSSISPSEYFYLVLTSIFFHHPLIVRDDGSDVLILLLELAAEQSCELSRQ